MKNKLTLFSMLISISTSIFCMEVPEQKNVQGSHIIINQTFLSYKQERKDEPLMLLFPGGRQLTNPEDPRGDQQKHEGFYTIDLDFSEKKCSPHLLGSIFNEELWEEIENETIDVTHIEIPGGMFLFDMTSPKREEEDAFILKKINQKSKIGGKLFVDLRHNRFWPMPNFNDFSSLEETKNRLRILQDEDPDSYFAMSYDFNYEQLASFWHALLGDPKPEIEEILKKNSLPDGVYIGDRENLETLQQRATEKLDTMSEEDKFIMQMPYAIYFNKEVRDNIYEQYDCLFRKYGFERTKPIIEIAEKTNKGLPLPLFMQAVGDTVIYEGMCFLETIAEYTKTKDLIFIDITNAPWELFEKGGVQKK